jgi:aldehyde dehydrogenase (NAD+)
MSEEIFGPILPVIAYRSLEQDVFPAIRGREKPLSLYIFSDRQQTIESILKNTTAGGTCVNHTLIHIANPDLPFGGVGHSGMGNYHGIAGFKAFSHERSVMVQSWLGFTQLFFPPYTSRVRKLVELALKYLA